MNPSYPRRQRRMLRRQPLLVLLGAGAILAACGGERAEIRHEYPSTLNRNTSGGDTYDASGRQSIFGGEGISLFGGGSRREAAAAADGGGVAVNTYLWRASLDTISFMPLASADPFGGVIITDWYTPPESPQERFKITVYILDRQLRADGVRVAVFKQQQDPASGSWVEAPVGAATASDIEDKILTRARELRVATLPQ